VEHSAEWSSDTGQASWRRSGAEPGGDGEQARSSLRSRDPKASVLGHAEQAAWGLTVDRVSYIRNCENGPVALNFVETWTARS
jgi:hypothetical protein